MRLYPCRNLFLSSRTCEQSKPGNVEKQCDETIYSRSHPIALVMLAVNHGFTLAPHSVQTSLETMGCAYVPRLLARPPAAMTISRESAHDTGQRLAYHFAVY